MEVVFKRMRKIRVLIVDDLLFMRTAMRRIIENGGLIVSGEAENGSRAITVYSKIKPDVVLMDITMPVMDGIQALRRIISLYPEARIIMCSSLGQNKYIMKSIQYGASDFIVKPFKPERIISSISKVLGIDEKSHS